MHYSDSKFNRAVNIENVFGFWHVVPLISI